MVIGIVIRMRRTSAKVHKQQDTSITLHKVFSFVAHLHPIRIDPHVPPVKAIDPY